MDTELPRTLQEMPNEFLGCRVDRHFWNFVEDRIVRNTRGRITMYCHVSQCPRCTTSREKWIAVPTYEVLSTRMYYPKGYLHPGGRLTSNEVQHEYFVRNVSREAA